MHQLRVGFIGFGIMGSCYAEALQTWPDTAVAAVTDFNDQRRTEAERDYKCPTFKHYADMLEKVDLDAVIVAVPDFLHHEPFLAAVDAGKHILVEKPFAMTIHNAEEMAKAVEKAGVKCQVEFSNRWGIQFYHARQRVRAGELGDILALSAELNDTVYVPTQMLSWAGQSTVAWFLMSHTTDLMTWITGKQAKRIFARGTKKLLVQRGIDTYDWIEALVEYDDGTTGRFTSGWILPEGFPIIYEFKVRLVGSRGAIDIDLSDQSMHVINETRSDHVPNAQGFVQGRYVGMTYEMLRAFVDAIQNDTEPLATVRDGAANTAVLVAVHKSLATGAVAEV